MVTSGELYAAQQRNNQVKSQIQQSRNAVNSQQSIRTIQSRTQGARVNAYRNYLNKTEEEIRQDDAEINKALPEVKAYEEAVRKQGVIDSVYRHYQKGMLWAVAGFGDPEEKAIAKSWIKQGVASNLGGTLDQKRYQIQTQAKLNFLYGTSKIPYPKTQSVKQVKIADRPMTKSSILNNTAPNPLATKLNKSVRWF